MAASQHFTTSGSRGERNHRDAEPARNEGHMFCHSIEDPSGFAHAGQPGRLSPHKL